MPGETQHQSSVVRSTSDVPWKLLDEITEPGSYVSRGSGDLIRVAGTGVSSGDAELKEKYGGQPIYVTQISKDPFVPISRARIAAADLDIEINF